MVHAETHGRRSRRICPRRRRGLKVETACPQAVERNPRFPGRGEGAPAPIISPSGRYRQTQPEKNEERSDGPIQNRRQRRTLSKPGAERAGKPRQDQAPDCSGGDKREPENHERDWLRRCRRIDKLRQEGEKKERDLGIENIGQDSLTKRRRGAAPFEMRGHGKLMLLFEERADSEKNQVGRTGKLT